LITLFTGFDVVRRHLLFFFSPLYHFWLPIGLKTGARFPNYSCVVTVEGLDFLRQVIPLSNFLFHFPPAGTASIFFF